MRSCKLALLQYPGLELCTQTCAMAKIKNGRSDPPPCILLFCCGGKPCLDHLNCLIKHGMCMEDKAQLHLLCKVIYEYDLLSYMYICMYNTEKAILGKKLIADHNNNHSSSVVATTALYLDSLCVLDIKGGTHYCIISFLLMMPILLVRDIFNLLGAHLFVSSLSSDYTSTHPLVLTTVHCTLFLKRKTCVI